MNTWVVSLLAAVFGGALAMAATIYTSIKIRNKLNHLDKRIAELDFKISASCEDVVSAVFLNGSRFKFPVPLGGPSIDPTHARFLHFLLQWKRPTSILELGSGSSTVIISRALDDLGIEVKAHVAVDHDDRFLNATRDLCKANLVRGDIHFIHCPLSVSPKNPLPWYSIDQRVLEHGPFDLILVDGPPAYTPELAESRGPSLPALLDNLSQDGILVLDDANRPGERAVQAKWRAAHPELVFHHNEGGKGFLTVSRKALV